MLRNKIHMAIVLLLPGLLAGCAEQKKAAKRQKEDTGVPVEVVEVQTDTFERTAAGIGTLQAAETVRIRPEISRRVKDIRFKEGAKVQKGSVLFTLEQDKLQRQLRVSHAQLALARARLQFAKKTYERYKSLTRDGVSTEERLDEARTKYEQRQAEVKRWKAQVQLNEERLRDTRIKAPFTGKAGNRRVDPGQLVDPTAVLTTLYRTDKLEARLSLPERYAGDVKEGQNARVQIDAYPDRTFSGPLTYVGPSVAESTRTFTVKATLSNKKGLLKPGAFVKADVVLDRRTDRPWVPEEALVATRTGYLVFVVEDSVARARTVKVGLRKVGRAEIRGGLKPGETVVRTGHMQLRDGARVSIRNTNENSDGADS